MILGDFVTFTVINTIFLIIFKKLYHVLNLRKIRYLLFGIYASFLAFEIYNCYKQPNAYKFFGLQRNFD